MPLPFTTDPIFETAIHAQLRETLSGLGHGHTVKVLLHGDAGLGKTVSVRYVLSRLGISNLLVLEGAANATRVAFYPIIQALGPVIGPGNKDQRRVSVPFRTLLELVKQVTTRGSIGPKRPEIASFLSGTQPATLNDAADMSFGIQKLLATLARENTLVLLFRNLETFDTSSISLLSTLLHNSSSPIAYVFTYDPLAAAKQTPSDATIIDEFVTEILHARDVSLFEFHPFTENETAAFIEFKLHAGALSNTQISSIHSLTGGNPEFILELLTHLQQEGELVLDEGRYSLRRNISLLDLPRNMARLIDLRVQRLQTELREVLDVAAVVGVEFQPEPITHILKLEHLTTLRRLREVERTHRLIIEEISARRFTYDAIRNRVYQQLGSSLAQEHHLLIANFFAANPLPFDNDYIVHEHLLSAGRSKEALPVLVRSAQQARTRGSHLEASERFLKATQMSERLELDGESTQELLMEAAISLQHAGKFSRAADLHRRLLQSQNPRIVAFAQLSLGFCEYLSDETWTAIESMNVALQSHGEYLFEEERTHVRLLLAAMLYHVGAWDAARAQYRKCFRDSLIRMDGVLLASVRKRINMFYLPELALPMLEESWRAMSETRIEPLRWELQHNVGCNYLLMGDLDRAAHLFKECLNAFERTGSYRCAYPMNNLGIVHLLQGRYDEADERFQSVREAPLSDFDRISADCHLALTQVLRGQVEAGTRILYEFMRDEAVSTDPILRELVAHNLGWALSRGGDLVKAEHYLLISVPTRPHLWREMKIANTARLLRRMGCALSSDALRQNEDLLDKSGRKDKWLFEQFDFWISEVWFWE
jgi:tetratricopeptide (TPR) repeat protein